MTYITTLAWPDDDPADAFADATAELTAMLRPTTTDTPHAMRSTLVEDTTLHYRAGMVTEVRIAPKWGNAVSDYLRSLRAVGKSDGTIYLRSYQLRVFSNAFRGRSPWTLTRDDVEAFMASQTHLSRATRRSLLTTIRGFYRFGREHEAETGLKVNPCEFIEPIKPPHYQPNPASEDDIRRALDAASPRAKLAIFIGAFCGLRRSEIARVKTTDLVPIAGGRMALKVIGKGERPRTVPVTPRMAAMIQECEPGYVFPSWHRGQIGADGSAIDKPITAGHLGVLMREALPAGVHPHMLRHRYASTVFAANGDLMAVKDLLGHTSVATTQVYTATPVNRLMSGVDAAGELH
jgi:integrase